MFRNFFKDESGQGMVEYALIIALIAIVLIGALSAMSGKVGDLFGRVGTALDEADTPAAE